MMKSLLRRIGLVAAVAALAGCAGEPSTGPAQLQPSQDASAGLLGSVTNLVLVPSLQRTVPLSSSITVSQTIGSAGGTLSIPAAGVTVVVPQGALSSNTVITMTARAGSAVAYDFAPHGITFAKLLTITQRLTGTNATVLNSSLLSLGYYSDASLLGTTTALVSELIGGNVNLLNWTFSAPIKHFSGYVISCGRGDE